MLHEIAHAIVLEKSSVRPRDGHHGSEWQRVGRTIGCTGRRTHDYPTLPARWRGGSGFRWFTDATGQRWRIVADTRATVTQIDWEHRVIRVSPGDAMLEDTTSGDARLQQMVGLGPLPGRLRAVDSALVYTAG